MNELLKQLIEEATEYIESGDSHFIEYGKGMMFVIEQIQQQIKK